MLLHNGVLLAREEGEISVSRRNETVQYDECR